MGKDYNLLKKPLYLKIKLFLINFFYSITILFTYSECNEPKNIDENKPLETDTEKKTLESNNKSNHESQKQPDNNTQNIDSEIDSNLEENIFEKEFSNPKNLIDEGSSYVSFDNINTAEAARLLVPKNKKIKNIFSLLEESEDNKKEFVNIFKILSSHYNNGLPTHNQKNSKNLQPMDMVIINTNVFCSKPNLLHIQEYSGYNTTPYSQISKLDFNKEKAIIENDTFVIYEILTFIPKNGLSSGKILLYKDPTKTFDDFFNQINSTESIQNDLRDILKKYEDFAPKNIKIHQNTRMIMNPNKSKNKKYDNYLLPENRFSMQLHATNDSSPPLYASV